MGKIENVEVYGLKESIIASGYPMRIFPIENYQDFSEKELARCIKLAQSPIGSGHDQFLTSIIVQFDLTFPLKAWVELQRYHFVDFCSSMSTMHRITQMVIEECCNEYVDEEVKRIVKQKVEEYKEMPTEDNFRRLIYNIPSGFEYTARLTTNYRQLKTIYSQRRTHRLPDWQMVCDWIETLPYAKELLL